MQPAVYVALSRQTALMKHLAVASNNAANQNTVGFQKEFLLYNSVPISDTKGNKLAYVKDAATVRDTSPGNLLFTNNPLDAAIEGNGYFTVSTPDGPRYTRAGNFKRNHDGGLVTAKNEYPVLSADGNAITFAPGADVRFSTQGEIFANNEIIGQLGISTFASEHVLQKVGDNLYKTSVQPEQATTFSVVVGALEESNVKSVSELTSIIEIQRASEAVTNLINMVEDLEQNTIKTLADTAK